MNLEGCRPRGLSARFIERRAERVHPQRHRLQL